MARRPLAVAVTLGLLLSSLVAANAADQYQNERDLGRRFAFEAAAELPLIHDPEVVDYVNRIGQRIVAALGPQPFSYHFLVVRDSNVNAFAVPGGYIYVHSGLLTRIANDDELAAVLGHEVAHVNAHHLAREKEATQLMNYATLLGVLASVVQPAIGAAALGANAAVQLKYSREFEQEADFLGATYMQKAGFEPRAMLDFFQKLWEDQRTTPTSVPPYLLSHPLTSQRLNALEATLKTKQWEGGPRPQASEELLRVQLIARVRSGQGKDVVDSYRKLVAENPADGRSRYLLGYALLESGSYDAAKQVLEAARELGYRDVDRELGRALLRLRQPQEARSVLARAVEIHPDDAMAQLEYGRVLEALSVNDQALAAYRRAAALDPDLGEAQYQLGMAAGRSGQAGEGFYHLGISYKLRGEYAQALSQLEKALPLLDKRPEEQQVKEDVQELREYLGKHRSLFR